MSSEEAELKAARERIRELEMRLSENQRLLDLSSDLGQIGTWRVDFRTGDLHWSKEVYAIHGLDPADGPLDMDKAISMYHPDDREHVQEVVDRAIQEKKDYDFELRIIRSDGELRQVLSRGRPELDANGNVYSLVGIFQDITEQKNEEKRLRRALERLRVHLDNTPLGVIEYTPEFRIAEWNSRAEEIFGYNREEAIGRHAAELIVPKHLHPMVHVVFGELLKQTGGSHSINDNVTKDGRTITCDWYNTTLQDADGQPMGVASICQDITDRRRLESQLVQTQKMEAIGTLAGGIAHDINNVLAVVMGMGSLLERQVDEGSSMQDDVREILSAAKRGKSMVDNLLGFARKGTYSRTRFSARDVVEQMVELLRKTVPKEIRLNALIAPGVRDIAGDSNQVSTALMNLCINASQAIRGRGTVTICAENVTVQAGSSELHPGVEPGSYVLLRVEDDGEGMDEATRARALEPFFTTKGLGEGTGLGLPMVYGTMENHKGEMRIESVPDEGTSVFLYFPVADELEAPQDANPAPPPRRLASLLIVDDESMILRTVQRLLENEGYGVLTAKGGAEAIELFEREQADIDLVLLDLSMPEMDGAECFEALRAIDAHKPIVFCTGHGTPELKKRMLDSGANGLLKKPFVLEELEATIVEVLGPRESQS